jgi:hypothetical protein
MMRGVTKNGTVVIGLVRSSLEILEAGEELLSPAYGGHGPAVVLLFAETDEELRVALTEHGRFTARTQETDLRGKRGQG